MSRKRNRSGTFEFEFSWEDEESGDGGEITAAVSIDYSPGTPAVMYLRNGDPGYPAEPAEVDIIGVTDLNGTEYKYDDLPKAVQDRMREKAYEQADSTYDSPEYE